MPAASNTSFPSRHLPQIARFGCHMNPYGCTGKPLLTNGQETNSSFCHVFTGMTVHEVWIGELDLLAQLGTTSNYSTIAYLHTLQIITRYAFS
jgi:hypothetical protein